MPDRCIVCNAPAQNRRIRRKVYWTPRAWRVSAAGGLLGIFAVGVFFRMPGLIDLFWWLLLLALVVHFLIRKSLKLELGICARHRSIRNLLFGASLACLLVLGSAFFFLRENVGLASVLFLASGVSLLLLGVVQTFIGIHAISLHDLSEEHAWLSGTGAPFRADLPEAN